jgi:type II secretory ATPase GspE/PulE/Tfp pilus assembly ATPase PilB-like protein
MALLFRKPQTIIDPKVHDQDLVKFLLKQKKINPQTGDYLLRKGAELQAPVAQIIENERILSEEDLARNYSKFLNLPYVDLSKLNISYEEVSRIPQSIAVEHKIASFESKNKTVRIAVADPYRLQSLKEGIITRLKKEKGIDVELFITTRANIEKALQSYNAPRNTAKPLPEKLFEEPVAPKSQPRPNAQPAPDVVVNVPKNTILEYIDSKKLLPPEKMQTVIENSKSTGKSYEDVIREFNVMSSDQLVRVQSGYMNIPYVFLRVVDIPENVLFKLPYDIAKKYWMIVFDVIAGKVLKIATSRPESTQVKEVLEFIKKRNDVEIELFVTTDADIEYTLARYQEYIQRRSMPQEATQKKSAKTPDQPKQVDDEGPIQITHTFQNEEEAAEASEENSSSMAGIDINMLVKQDIRDQKQVQAVVETKSVPKILAALINYALNLKSSDIHIEPTEGVSKVRFRVDGVLHNITDIPRKLHPALVSRVKISAQLRLDEQRVPQDGRFDVKLKDRGVDLRVSTLPTVHGEKVVMRLLDKSQQIFSLTKLGLTGRALDILTENIKKPFGMILSTGPTGSGKSTSLYAVLQNINSAEINIITLEDPVEYDIEGVNQCQVKASIGFSFAEGLRSVLRQDPDVILVGEIRDKETAAMAIHSSLTGHLVLSTLHTNDASGAAPRLIDMGIEPFLIISSTNVFVGQRLVRKICETCKAEITPPPAIVQNIEKDLADISPKAQAVVPRPLKFYRGKGCSKCSNTGYTGRIGIFEVLPMSEGVSKLIVERASGAQIKRQAITEGMLTMSQDGLLKVLQGVTSIDEVLRVTSTA